MIVMIVAAIIGSAMIRAIMIVAMIVRTMLVAMIAEKNKLFQLFFPLVRNKRRYTVVII